MECGRYQQDGSFLVVVLRCSSRMVTITTPCKIKFCFANSPCNFKGNVHLVDGEKHPNGHRIFDRNAVNTLEVSDENQLGNF
jgi:hypothetical protein